MIGAVILDLDGTLVDSNQLHAEAFARALHEVGRDVPRATIHRQIGKGADQFLPALVGGDAAAAQTVEGRARQIYRQHLAAFVYPLPGAAALLRSLRERGVQAWLGTSANPGEIAAPLASLGGEGLVTGIVSAGEVEASKPDPDIFGVALRRCGLRPDEVLVLGDTVWDVEAASRAGLRAACVLTGGAFSRAELEETGAVAVFDDCAELLASGFPDGF